MSTSYLEIVNNVLRMMRWSPTTSGSFDDPGEPAASVKYFVNQAKDYVLNRLDKPLIEREYAIVTADVSSHDSTSATLSSPTGTYVLFVGSVSDIANFSGRKFSCGYSTMFHEGWYRIISRAGNIITLDCDLVSSGTYSGDWYVFQDEYDLDADVRQVISAWRQSDGTPLDIVSEPHYLDEDNPGKYESGAVERIAVWRSPTEDMIWQVQIYPVPTSSDVIRIKTRARCPDLSAATDDWELEDDIVRMIETRAVQMAFGTKVQADPDLALTTRIDLKDMIADYRSHNFPNDPGRRLRRRGPGEAALPTDRPRRIVVESS